MIKNPDKPVSIYIILITVFSYLTGGLVYAEYFYAVSAPVLIIPLFLKKNLKTNRQMLLVFAAISVYAVFMCFFGINREKAVLGSGNMIFFLAVYLIFSAVTDGKHLLNTIMRTLIWCSVFTFAVNLSALIFRILPSIDGKNAFSLVIPYPNTLGTVFAISAFGCLREKHPLYIFAHIICLLGMFLTYSTGAVIIYFAAVCLYLLFAKKFKILIFLVATLSIGFIAAVHTISLSGFSERWLYYRDAISIFIDFPFGCGKGGWSSIYPQYQTGVYATENVHSVFFQLMTDYGIAGIALFVWMIAGGWNLCRKGAAADYETSVFAGITGFMIVGHGMTDADFEFPLIVIILIAVFTSVIKLSDKDSHTLNINTALRATFALLAICFSIASVSWFCYASGYKSYINNDSSKAVSQITYAVRLNPCCSSGYYLLYQMSGDEDYINTASKLDPHNPKHLCAVAAVANSEQAWLDVLEKQPFNIGAYEKLFEMYEYKNETKKINELYESYTNCRQKIADSGKKLKNNSVFELSDKAKKTIEKANLQKHLK